MDTWLVTGGAGFIGGNFVLAARRHGWARIVNLDKLTYAGNCATLGALQGDKDHIFVQGDIGNHELLAHLLANHRPSKVFHFAAESHVDRSIGGAGPFFATNVVGTLHLLEAVKSYWQQNDNNFDRFIHVSTDEVFGSLSSEASSFTEASPIQPNSPYAASKAASDHVVRSFYKTYGFPGIVTHCSNNYGPYQFPEKLIPLVIIKALRGENLPVYGKGDNIRDWLYVDDHITALKVVGESGHRGEAYNIGGDAECSNLSVVESICRCLDTIRPRRGGRPYEELITFVTDRPGHDFRYSIDSGHIRSQLGWKPAYGWDEGLSATIRWYLDNQPWWQPILEGKYEGQRLGLAGQR